MPGWGVPTGALPAWSVGGGAGWLQGQKEDVCTGHSEAGKVKQNFKGSEDWKGMRLSAKRGACVRQEIEWDIPLFTPVRQSPALNPQVASPLP